MSTGRVSLWGRGRLFAAVALLASTIVFGIAAKPASAALGITGTVGAPTSTVFGKLVTFTGTINNTGTGAAEAFTAVTFADAGSVGLSTIVPVPVAAVAAGTSAPFTVTAVVSGTPGSSAQLKLTATGVTANAADVDPTGPVVGAGFTVTDAVVLTVTTERNQAGVYTPCLPASCTVSIDDGLRYTVTVTNVSDVPATDVKITAPAPANTTTVAATTTIPAAPITLAPGVPQSFVQEVTVNDPINDATPPQPGDVLTFTASATYDTALPAVLNDRPAGGSPVTFLATVVDPRLTITNVLHDNNGGQLVRGDPVLSTITVDNTGNADATNTKVTVALTNLSNPIDVNINGGNPAPPARVVVTPTTVTVLIGNLPPGPVGPGGTVTPADAPIVVTFLSTVVNSPTGSPPKAMSTASVSFDNGGVSPKTATAELDILPQPSISLLITPTPASPGPVARGGLISYQIAATNGTGVAAATNLQISFPIPAQTTFQNATTSAGGSAPAGGPAGPITTTFANVPAGATVTLTVSVMVNANATETVGAANDIVANATATFGPGTNPTVPAPTVGHELSVAQLNITNAMSDVNGGQLLRGEVVTNTTTVDNTGTADATGVSVTVALTNVVADPTSVKINGLPAPAAQVDITPTAVTVRIGSGAGAAGGTITPAATPISVSFNATVVAAPTGSPPRAQTSATAAFGNGGGSNGPVVAQLDIVANPAVTLSIGATPAVGTPVDKDTNITYVVTASNAAGVADAKNVQLSFGVPANTTFVSASAPAGTAPAGAPAGPITTTFATIAAGASATLTVVVHVSATPTKTPGVTPANDIVASATATYGPGSNPSANASVAHEISAADLTLTVVPLSQNIQKKKPADVVFTIGNNGPNPATGTKTLTVDLTGAGAIQSAAGCTVNAAGTQAVCPVTGPIASGGNVPFTVKVQSDSPGTATLTGTLVTTGVEIDENAANNGSVVATVGFQQSETNLTIAGSSPVSLIFGNPTQTITYTLSVSDPQTTGANKNDPAEGVQVTIPIPAGLQATAAAFSGAVNGTCTVPAGPGGTVTCVVGDIVDGGTVSLALTLQGTALLAATPVTATATLTNTDLSQPNTASVLVTVVPQPVDLSVNDNPDAIIQAQTPNDTFGRRLFTVTVKNNSAIYTATSYSVTVDTTAPVADAVLNLPPNPPTPAQPTCSVTANVFTCTGTNLAPGQSKDFIVEVRLNVTTPVTIRSTVSLTSPTQAEPAPDPTSNTDTWNVSLNRPPDVKADMGPTIPAGNATGPTTLVYDVLTNDTDADLNNLTITSATAPAAAAVTVTVDAGKKVRVVATSATPLGTFDVTYVVNDGRESTTQSATLKVKVVAAITREAQGSFGHAQPAAKTFGHDIAPARIGDTATQVDVVNVLDTGAALGKQADGTDYPTGLSYNVVNVNPGSLNVAGSLVSLQAVTAAPPTTPPSAPRNVISYTPAKGYTSDPGQHPASDPPADDFTYTNKGLQGAVEVFSVDAGVSVEVKNQNPIGVDSTFDVPNGVTQVGKPAGNDIDGNTVKDPITTKRPAQSFVFDDEGILDPVRLLKIRCIGPVPALDPTTNLPATLADAVCPDSGPYSDGWKKPGEELVLETPDSHGKVTAKLDADLQNVSMSADATAVGNLDFAYVIVDDHGGAGFGLATARVPNTPPQVIEGVRTVIKNTPTLVVDTKLATQDANGDTIKVSSAPDTTEQGGKVVIGDSSRTITYTPKKDYLGPDKLLYNVSDGRADGAASAILQLNVIEQPTDLTVAGTGGTGAAAGGAAAGSPAGSLAKTGGDPLPLTAAAGCSLVLGLALVQAGRRRGSRPLLDQARHLRT